MTVLLLKRSKIAFLSINIRNKEERHMLVINAPGRSFDIRKFICILYQVKAEIIYFVSRVLKICNFMRSLLICGFKVDAL